MVSDVSPVEVGSLSHDLQSFVQGAPSRSREIIHQSTQASAAAANSTAGAVLAIHAIHAGLKFTWGQGSVCCYVHLSNEKDLGCFG